ncbi:hypothetical protein NN6n1_18550 [Shinella zoogloeoides]
MLRMLNYVHGNAKIVLGTVKPFGETLVYLNFFLHIRAGISNQARARFNPSRMARAKVLKKGTKESATATPEFDDRADDRQATQLSFQE